MGFPDICEKCESNFIRTRDKKHCVLKNEKITNCVSFSSVNCNKCKTGFDINRNFYFHDFDEIRVNGENGKNLLENFLVYEKVQEYPLKTC